MLFSTPPPQKKMEMIVGKLACFIKQTNIFIQRKMTPAITSSLCIHMLQASNRVYKI
jgi:hypothetical protein